MIAGIIFRQKDQMVIPVLIRSRFPVKTGARRNVDLAADNWLDSGFQGFLIEFDHTVHDAVVRDGQGIHSQFLCPGNTDRGAAGLEGARGNNPFILQVQVRNARFFSGSFQR